MTRHAIAAADALGSAIRARDAEILRSLYADDVVIWHASTRKGMGKDENIALLSGVFKVSRSLQYQNIRRHLVDDGLVQQHQLTGTFSDGASIPILESCMVIKVRDEQIIRIDEYFDSQSFAEMWKRLGT